MRQFNRRQMLKVMGVGSASVLLGGLTGCTSLLTPGDPRTSAELGLSAQGAFARTRKAIEGLNKSALRMYSKELKDIFKEARKAYENRSVGRERFQELVKEAQQVDLKIIDLFSEADVWTASDQDWLVLLNRDPHAMQFLATEVARGVNSVSHEVGLSKADKREWIQAYAGWTKGSLIKAIQQDGLERLWLDEADTITVHLLSLSAHGQSEAAVAGQQFGEILVEALLDVLLYSVVACSNPCPSPPPPPPPPCSGECPSP